MPAERVGAGPFCIIAMMKEPRGHVFFDGGCGVCSAGARRWGRLLARHGLELVPFQDPRADTLLNRSPADPLPGEMELRTTDGGILGGVDAIAYIARKIWWAFPLHLLLLVPPVRGVARMAYRWFAKRRRRISTACGLRPMIP